MSDYWRERVPPSLNDFDTLARYNAERSRGIVHDPEWVARMAEIQDHFNHVMLARQMAASAAIPTKQTLRRQRWWRR